MIVKCINCTEEIPPSWVAAIQSNICPACGKNILDEFAQNLMAEIRDAFKQMDGNPEGLAGWLLSNYDIRKKGELPAEPVIFYGNKQPRNSQKSIPNVNSLMDRAGAPIELVGKSAQDVIKNSKYTKIINAIHSGSMEDMEDSLESAEEGFPINNQSEPLNQAEMQILAQAVENIPVEDKNVDRIRKLKKQGPFRRASE